MYDQLGQVPESAGPCIHVIQQSVLGSSGWCLLTCTDKSTLTILSLVADVGKSTYKVIFASTFELKMEPPRARRSLKSWFHTVRSN